MRLRGSWRLRAPAETDAYAVARPLLVVLALPTVGLAAAISLVTTYGPVVLAHLTTSAAEIGVLIGGEGAFALVVPLIAGSLSDRLGGPPVVRRLAFVAVGAPLVVAALVVLPFSPSYPAAAGVLLAFFVGYYVAYPPYRALYADLLPQTFYARAQAGQAMARGIGLGIALLAGGLLLSAWRPLPFVVGAAALAVATAALWPVRRVRAKCPPAAPAGPAESFLALLRHHPELRAFAVANLLWEFSFTGLKSFIALYVVRGLGESPSLASAAIAVVAVTYLVAAPFAGRLADRYGIVRVLRVSSAVYGSGLLVGLAPTTLWPMLAGLPFVALAGAVVMTLPQALAFTVAPEGREGAVAGLQDFSRGIGVVLGPVAVGAAVELCAGLLPATHGYAVMWPVVGVPVLATLLVLGRIEHAIAPRPSGP